MKNDTHTAKGDQQIAHKCFIFERTLWAISFITKADNGTKLPKHEYIIQIELDQANP